MQLISPNTSPANIAALRVSKSISTGPSLLIGLASRADSTFDFCRRPPNRFLMEKRLFGL